ncbi:MarR family transcriptional regulator [Mycoplasmatota bacterium WC44]
MDKSKLRNEMCSVFIEVRRSFVHELSDLGLSYQQWNVLKLIKSSDEPISAKILVEKMNSDKATISGILKRLVSNKYIKEKKNPSDKRETLLFLSTKSTGLCDKVMILEENFNNKIYANLSEEDMEQLSDLLQKIVF